MQKPILRLCPLPVRGSSADYDHCQTIVSPNEGMPGRDFPEHTIEASAYALGKGGHRKAG